MRIALIGLGEVGAIYAAALLELGHSVIGADPGPVDTPEGAERADSAALAAEGADMVIVLTSATVGLRVAAEVAPHLGPGAVYADFTSASPATMREVAETVAVDMADVAILGSVPLRGARTPLIASGPGAPAVALLADQLGAPIEVLDSPVGEATGHKLLRSVFMKGLAMIIIEALEAGRAVDAEEWVRAQIAATLAGGPPVVDRLVTGSLTHAERQAQEMVSVADYLAGLGVPTEMTDAGRRALEALRDGEAGTAQDRSN